MEDLGAIDRRKSNAAFKLLSMSEIYETNEGKADIPHRHDYYTVLFIIKARGVHNVDYVNYKFSDNEVHFVSPGQVHQVALNEKPEGYAITFSPAFLSLNNIPERFISDLSLFRTFDHNPPVQLDAKVSGKLKGIIDEMLEIQENTYIHSSRAYAALLQMFLFFCANSKKVDTHQLDEENKAVCMLRDFKSLVDSNYKKWHKVATYAQQLHITTKHLSVVTKKQTGKTAKEMIQDRIVLEAKRLLLYTDMSIKEVGYALGFDEPLHFSSFFKNCHGHSPSHFRTEQKA